VQAAKILPKERSADILVRSKWEHADIRRKFQSGGADEHCCGQECPRSGLVAALPPWASRPAFNDRLTISIFQFAFFNFQSNVRTSFMRAFFVVPSFAIILAFGCVRTVPPLVTNKRAPQSDRSQSTLPGKQPDGSVLLPNQWSLQPAGTQIELRDFPINVSVHPNNRFAAVLHSAYSANQVSIVDLISGHAVSHAPIEQSFYGLEFSSDGKRLFCSGAGEEVIHSFDNSRP